jgi:hypothetical protein
MEPPRAAIVETTHRALSVRTNVVPRHTKCTCSIIGAHLAIRNIALDAKPFNRPGVTVFTNITIILAIRTIQAMFGIWCSFSSRTARVVITFNTFAFITDVVPNKTRNTCHVVRTCRTVGDGTFDTPTSN